MVWKSQTPIAIGRTMKRIPNSVVSGLIRILPILIEQIPLSGQSLKTRNAVRQAKRIIVKLQKLKMI